MAIQVKHKFVSAKVDTLDNSKVQPSNWNDTHDILLAGGVVVGRAAGAGQAAATEIPMGAMGQTLIGVADAAAARAAIVADDSRTTVTGAATKSPPVDADQLAIIDSAAGSVWKRLTFTALKSFLKTYFDTIYQSINNGTFAGTVTAIQNFVSSTTTIVLAASGAGGIVILRPNGAGSGSGQAYVDNAGTLSVAGSVVAAGTYYRGGTPIPFTLTYDSGQLAITTGGVVTVAHGLGARPKLVTAVLQCVTAEAGYNVGDEVPINIGKHDGSPDRGFGIRVNPTTLDVYYGTDGSVMEYKNGSTGGNAALTNSRWRLVLRAFN